MERTMRKFFLTASILFTTLFFCACPLKITVDCDKDERLSVNFSSQLGDAFIESLSQIQQISSENGENSPNLSEISNKIESELNAKFFKNAKVNFGQKSLDAAAQVASIKKFPKEFINVQKAANGKKIFTLALSPESLAASILQEDSAAKTLADILMAPLISGEEMQLQEYKELLSEIYGDRLANEILSGDLVVEFIAGGKKQTQKIPVADLLLSTEKNFMFEF